MKNILWIGVGVVAISVLSYFGWKPTAPESLGSTLSIIEGKSLFEMDVLIDIPEVKYGFIVDEYKVEEGEIKQNEVLSNILSRNNVSYVQIDKLVQNTKDVFDFKDIRVGKPYMVLSPKEGNLPAEYFIYKPNAFEYIVYDLRDNPQAEVVHYPVDTMKRTASGVILSSLWNAMEDNNISYQAISKMEQALAWSVDFYHIQQNDKFKLIYDELYIEDELVGVGEVDAAYFESNGTDHYAFYFEDESYAGFFDTEGRPMKKAFLKSPVEYARISSAFNLRRFHPILKRVKPHLGTDYAAPYGTPILAVANGTVTKRSRTRGNGNFVKIKHDNVYETQYLHMQKFAKGVNVGTQVKQGQVIGYVGSTGLATGPHVCFRFWKNGKQIDHRKENLPPPEPMSGESLEIYKTISVELKEKIDAIPYQDHTKKEEIALKQDV